MKGYHVTSEHLLSSIQEKGLIPQVPSDYGLNGDDKGVYLFPTKQDAINALYGWLGERIEEMEEELNIDIVDMLITVDMNGLEFMDNTHFFPEYVVLETIHPSRFISINPI